MAQVAAFPDQSGHNIRKSINRAGKLKMFTQIFGSDGHPRIPDFQNVQVSTMTIIAHTNLIINTQKFYSLIPTTDYIIVKKKRGRKKKVQPEDPNKDVPPGSIISLTKKRFVRGVVLKQKKKKSLTFFRHSVSVVMVLTDQKCVNVKVSRNGKLQMTGCKTMTHAIDFIKHMYSLMIEAEEWTGETLFTYKTSKDDEGEDIQDKVVVHDDDDSQELKETEPPLERYDNLGLNVVFRCVMRNIDFGAGYRIRRDLLNTYINRYTDFRSIFESSIGTSVNIKIRALNRTDPEMTRLRITGEGECIEDTIRYEDFFSTLSAKDQRDEKRKQKWHTFLVFASGSIIMSSAGGEMPFIFYKLVKLLVDHRREIEEKGDTKVISKDWLDREIGEKVVS